MESNEDFLLDSITEGFDAPETKYNLEEPVYHYTSPQGLLGIIHEPSGTDRNKPTLWFTRYDSLNDINEGQNIIKIYKNVCDELHNVQESKETPKIDDAMYNEIISVEPSTKALFSYQSESDVNTIIGRTQECVPYVCCFSMEQDSLPMWNYYVKNNRYNGYNICFSFFETENTGVKSGFGLGYRFKFFKVVYDDEEKKELLKEKILWVLEKTRDMHDRVQEIRSFISGLLTSYSLAFKSPDFANEKEVRAVIWLPNDGNKKFKTKYRDVNGYIIPYIEADFDVDNVQGITIAPLHNDKIAKRNIEQMLKDYGYNVNTQNIKNSEVPIRY